MGIPVFEGIRRPIVGRNELRENKPHVTFVQKTT